MISRKQWVVLFGSYLLYLLAGSAVFLHLEADNELQNERTLLQLQRKLSGLVISIQDDQLRESLESAIQELGSHIGEDLFIHGVIYYDNPGEEGQTTQLPDLVNYITQANVSGSIGDEPQAFVKFPEEDIEGNLMWNLWNSFFFSFTAITTIGFGHMFPKTESGQLFCVLYSVFGVPFNGIVFAGLGDLFSSKFIAKVDSGRYKKKWKVVLDSCFYLVPGLVVLMFLPALIIMYFEDWSFLEAFYYAFITVTTIGFGDYVAGYAATILSGPWLYVYRVCIMGWICFGLGYLLMVVAFIQRALRSEEFRKIDRTMKKVFRKKAHATAAHIRVDLERIRRILLAISKARHGKEHFEEEIPDSQKKEPFSHDILDSPNIQVTNVEILLELAETVMAAKASAMEPETNVMNHLAVPHGSHQHWEDNTALELGEEARKGRPGGIMRKLSTSLNFVRRPSKSKLPPSEEEESKHLNSHTLGDILDQVEDILQEESARTFVDAAIKRRASCIRPPIGGNIRRGSVTFSQPDAEEVMYLKDIKQRRNTLATLLVR